MPMFETEWGTLNLAGSADAKKLIKFIKGKRREFDIADQWKLINNTTGFAAFFRPLSMEAIKLNGAQGFIKILIVFKEKLNTRHRDTEWEFEGFCYYKINGRRYRIKERDMPIDHLDYEEPTGEYDEYSKEEEAYGSKLIVSKTKMHAYLRCTSQELAKRGKHYCSKFDCWEFE